MLLKVTLPSALSVTVRRTNFSILSRHSSCEHQSVVFRASFDFLKLEKEWILASLKFQQPADLAFVDMQTGLNEGPLDFMGTRFAVLIIGCENNGRFLAFYPPYDLFLTPNHLKSYSAC